MSHGIGVSGRRGRDSFALVARAVAPALAVAAVLAPAGCAGGQAEPSPGPSSTSTTTAPATPAPSPTRSAPPERPAAMDRDDLEGAKAAAQYFLELYPYAYNTGDLTEWTAMSHPECIFCASVIENVEALHAEGGYEVGGDLVFESVTGAEPIEGNEFYGVDFVLTQSAATEYDKVGAEVRDVPEGPVS